MPTVFQDTFDLETPGAFPSNFERKTGATVPPNICQIDNSKFVSPPNCMYIQHNGGGGRTTIGVKPGLINTSIEGIPFSADLFLPSTSRGRIELHLSDTDAQWGWNNNIFELIFDDAVGTRFGTPYGIWYLGSTMFINTGVTYTPDVFFNLKTVISWSAQTVTVSINGTPIGTYPFYSARTVLKCVTFNLQMQYPGTEDIYIDNFLVGDPPVPGRRSFYD